MPGGPLSSAKESKPDDVYDSEMGNEASNNNAQPDEASKGTPDESSRVESKQSRGDQKPDPRNSNVPTRVSDSSMSVADSKRPTNPARKTRQVAVEENGARHDIKTATTTGTRRSTGTRAASVGGGDVSEYNYSDYYRPVGYGDPVLAARAVLHTAPAPCRCYPKRSSHGIPSMMYDRVTCQHHGVRGSAHDGVYAFDDGWSVTYETSPRPRTRKPADIAHVRGYPRPELEAIPESPALSEASAELRDLFDNESVSSGNKGRVSTLSNRTRSRNSQRNSVTRSDSGRGNVSRMSKPSRNSQRESTTGHGNDPHEHSLPPSRRSGSAVSIQQIQQGTQTDDIKSRRMTIHRLGNQEERPTTRDIENMNVPEIGYPPSKSQCSRHSSATSPRDREGEPIPRASSVDGTEKRKSPVIRVKADKPKRFGVNYMVKVFTPVPEEHLVTTDELRGDNHNAREPIHRDGPFTGTYQDPVTHQSHRYEVPRGAGSYLLQQ